ncbi:exodeoxyribonuclease VII small subunit [Kocuria rhizophila]|uniref:exodeoxyribonuclease VII small subunit n=1 Tax=Kocuria TaxID=57493 RepID=UPI00057DBFF1|nr:exodeoxyribonuclease VII small subunit [Kocuria rhizophila]KIC67005.1 exodeoxyribonuclease VII small subunit [Kocuria rhizophila]MCR4525809.1 exodeoxyribonuclease VII small subunit [Kocuria rhizophila]MCT2171166.1 exodeoxyribonuclease VII small subunit [Kocuria rhizophila]
MAQQNQSTDSQQGPQQGAPDLSDIDQLGYEQAREQLVQIVSQLETGGASLEESLRLWERGEALATRCEQWLDGARERLDAARARRENRDQAASDAE